MRGDDDDCGRRKEKCMIGKNERCMKTRVRGRTERETWRSEGKRESVW